MSDLISEKELSRAVRKIIASVSKFCFSLLGFKAFPYQAELLEDRSKRIVVCAGRQVGKSLLIAARALWFAFTHPKSTTIIISATQSQSIMTFDKILTYIDSSSHFLQNSIIRKTRTLILLSNGSRVLAKPCGRYGRSLRGETAHFIIVDESAFVPEEVIGEVLMPMLSTTNGSIILLSTPYDKNHFFYGAFNSPDRWSRYRFKTSDNPLVKKEFLDEQLEMWGERRFRQEYLAEFIDDEDTFLPMTLLRSRVHICDSVPCSYCRIISGSLTPQGELFAGYDPGGLSDPAALVVVQKLGPSAEKKSPAFRVVLVKSFVLKSSKEKNKKTTRELVDSSKSSLENVYTKFTVEISDIHKKLHFEKMTMDSTGLGRPIFEHCVELGLPAKGLLITSKAKEEILSNLKILLENGEIELPDNIDLLSSLNSIIAKRTRTGGYYFDHESGTHDDLTFALALALWGAKSGSGKIAIIRRDPPPSSGSWRESSEGSEEQR